MFKSVVVLLAWMLSGAAGAQAMRAEAVAGNLENPWAVAFLPEGRFLVTERPGRLRVIEADGRVGEPVTGLPELQASGQGGLLDVVTDGAFARNRMLYLCFSQPGAGGAGTALASARLATDLKRLEDVKIIFSQNPKVGGGNHFGCRIVEARDGTLFLTLGDRYSQMANAQTLDNHHGKVVRINKDGTVPKDNPFAARAGALPEIWSYGHRNLQGATLSPDGVLWTHEHGPQGGDEINVPRAGSTMAGP
jgi:glucose/arabinose dehydrogenase